MRGAAETQTAQSFRAIIAVQRKALMEKFTVEQKKLEAMITKMVEKGLTNFGTNQSIIEQSKKLDQIVVDEMMMEEMLKELE